jgi:dihydroorotate dehydrogenase
MNTSLVRTRNAFESFLYRKLLKPMLFMQDPEAVHDRMARFGVALGSHGLTRALVKLFFGGAHDPILEQTILGIYFKNPIGLAAGFDKNAELTAVLPAVGFGFEEVGSITGEPCAGNPKPRLWRLPQSQSLVVYYGLKNDGAEVIAKRLRAAEFGNVIGTSVAMTNHPDNLDMRHAVLDYAKAFKLLSDIGDYTTLNISCPNTQGGQPFICGYKLDYLLDIIDEIPSKKPIFIKLSPDIAKKEIEDILAIAHKHRVHGIICTNLTKKRDNARIIDKRVPSVGGMSGKVVQGLSDDLLSFIYKKELALPADKRFVLVGCGGVFTAEDAYKKIRAGASLIQLITGMIYQGPQAVSEIELGLAELIRRDGFTNIAQAVGADVR